MTGKRVGQERVDPGRCCGCEHGRAQPRRRAGAVHIPAEVFAGDAQAEVTVRLTHDGSSVTGRGADPDTLVSSAKAYLVALNKLMAKGSRLHAQAAAG